MLNEQITEVVEREAMLDYVVEHKLGKMTLNDIREMVETPLRSLPDAAIQAIYKSLKKLEDIKTA